MDPESCSYFEAWILTWVSFGQVIARPDQVGPGDLPWKLSCSSRDIISVGNTEVSAPNEKTKSEELHQVQSKNKGILHHGIL